MKWWQVALRVNTHPGLNGDKIQIILDVEAEDREGYNAHRQALRPSPGLAGDNPDPLTYRRIELAENWQEEERQRLAAEAAPVEPGSVPLTRAGIVLALAIVALVITLFVVGVL